MTDLKELLQIWQARLRLQDWHIKVSMARAREMPVESAKAGIKWSINTKEAWISVLDPIDLPPEEERFSIEEAIVHELLHLHFALMDELVAESDAVIIALEQAIVCIAGALVENYTPREGITV